ncbi:hypothetical protein MNBD_GAMMA11-2881 [hydrothermal vent metagenome]|uniref:Uncharacterized protein n=1 Tax=hydrothermal vent metagenome TaxID=652676 RepID=A0A3B0XPA1_9ZZZZ
MCQPDHPSQYPALKYFLYLYKNNNELQACCQKLDKAKTPEELTLIYTQALPLIEKNMWQKEINDSELKYYQQLFHEMESFISHNEDKLRHQFIVAIPVADRPQHLNTCLLSLLNLCKAYNYGGFKEGKYRKIRALIADDSKHEKNRIKHREIAQKYSKKGLEVIYSGQSEQKKIAEKYHLNDILKRATSDSFHHKGASTTRNITYLKLREISENNEKTLFYFIDSDQEFQIKPQPSKSDKNLYSINYLYYLNQIFSLESIVMLTGKVVGDPPVSPSVMTANFLDDILNFITRISEVKPEQNCLFHRGNKCKHGDASYHDMADLFGFKISAESQQYNCPLQGEHNHIQCFSDLSTKLSQFFDGAHPTRKSYYEYKNALLSIAPARTVYTGNYIFNRQGLKYFIPFSNLKLRMAGPTLGRIIKADIGDQFVSSNLPMLHTRTVKSTGQSEFRPGIKHLNSHKDKKIDLSIEFGRQFFGDVMLFSIEELSMRGYPREHIKPEVISDIVSNTIKTMLEKYNIKHNEIMVKINTLKSLLNNQKSWWNQTSDMKPEKKLFITFINNIEYNFGREARAYAFINSAEERSAYQQKISSAIATYNADMKIWQEIIR